jgi:hypothetical protein
MDIIDFGGLFAFTGVDIYTREADIFLAPELTAHYGYQFLERSMLRRFDGHVHLLQTDGGLEFKDEFKAHAGAFCDRHRISRPTRKTNNAILRVLIEAFGKNAGWIKYREGQIVFCTRLVEAFLDQYHYHRPHMGLGMKPPLTRKETDCRISTEN